ncbi:MAG: glycosyltransferase [Deltaproteobacteria bacterium]|nr:glycosyltransferase [Deltaproteobacteria bacterium]
MKGTPKISIVVPTYNRDHLIGDCIESILSQTMTDFEIIVVSDGSTDNSRQVVDQYRDTRIRFFEKVNGGQSSARNLGIMKSKGKYISFCDDDDRIYPDHLITLSNHLNTNEDVGLVYSDAIWICKDGSKEPYVVFSQDFDKKSLENYNYITTQTVMFRRSCLDKTGLFNETPILRNGLEDWEFLLRLSDRHAFAHIRKVTGEYTVHGGNSFHPKSEYDYAKAFFFVRTHRFGHLLSSYGPSLFDHVDHMYPFHLVQCYLNVGSFDGAVQMAFNLYDRYKQYCHVKNRMPITELVILFSLGISHFATACREKAKVFFDGITSFAVYESIQPQFNAFVSQYVSQTCHPELKGLLCHSFRLVP